VGRTLSILRTRGPSRSWPASKPLLGSSGETRLPWRRSFATRLWRGCAESHPQARAFQKRSLLISSNRRLFQQRSGREKQMEEHARSSVSAKLLAGVIGRKSPTQPASPCPACGPIRGPPVVSQQEVKATTIFVVSVISRWYRRSVHVPDSLRPKLSLRSNQGENNTLQLRRVSGPGTHHPLSCTPPGPHVSYSAGNDNTFLSTSRLKTLPSQESPQMRRWNPVNMSLIRADSGPHKALPRLLTSPTTTAGSKDDHCAATTG